jgi:protein-S-isoprenylcysteine O-methyltransferase Ste14
MIYRIIQTAFRSHIYLMVVKVYIPVLFPLTFLICLFSTFLDAKLGFGNGIIAQPLNYIIAGCTFFLGAVFWLWTYEQLSRIGEGSPSPTAGRTIKLVKTGIYAFSRNPSIFGKLLGFLSIGIAINSFSFCFILAPMLLTGSLIEKVLRQEPQLVELFGEEYQTYRKNVPLFIPWKIFFPKRS